MPENKHKRHRDYRNKKTIGKIYAADKTENHKTNLSYSTISVFSLIKSPISEKLINGKLIVSIPETPVSAAI